MRGSVHRNVGLWRIDLVGRGLLMLASGLLMTGCVCFRPPTDQDQFTRHDQLKKEGFDGGRSRGRSSVGEAVGDAVIGALIDSVL